MVTSAELRPLLHLDSTGTRLSLEREARTEAHMAISSEGRSS